MNPNPTQPPTQPSTTPPVANSPVPNSGVDQTVVNLARSIRQHESKGNYNAVGDNGTSQGAFQYQPDTWKLYAGQILKDPNAPMTRENQNAVTYGTLKRFKDSGMDAAQSVAAWNAGEKKALDGSWQKNVGTNMINGKPIAYDTPSYVKNVLLTYQQYKSGVQQPIAPQSPSTGGGLTDTAYAADGSEIPKKEEGLGTQAWNFAKDVGSSIIKAPVTGAVRGGELAGVGIAGLASKITGNPKYYERAVQAADSSQQVPVLGTNIKPISEETPESIAGQAVSTVAPALGGPALSGAAIGAGNALQNNESTASVLGKTVLGGVTGYLGGKLVHKVSEALKPISNKISDVLIKSGSAADVEAPEIAGTIANTGLTDITNQGQRAVAKNVLDNMIDDFQNRIGSATSDTVKTQLLQNLQSLFKARTVIDQVERVLAASPEAQGLFSKIVGGGAKKLASGLFGAGLTGLATYQGTNPKSFVRQFLSTGNPE